MAWNCQEKHCAIRKLCGELSKLGCGGEPAWLGLLLFVRDLVSRFSLLSNGRKTEVQRFVFDELAKRDASEGHLRQVLDGLEAFLEDSDKARGLARELESEKRSVRDLAVSVGAFLRETLTSERERETLVRRFGNDALATLDSDADPAEMAPRMRALVTDMLTHYREEAKTWELRATQLEQAMRVDPLLAPLHNRRSLDDHLDKAIATARDAGGPLSVLMIDVDNFKTTINDVHGHAVGDDVLRTLAKLTSLHAERHGSFAARYGGDELVLVCALPAAEAELHADAIRLAVQHYEFRPRIDGRLTDTPIRFTVSIGVAAYRPGMTPADLVDAADKAMYRVKGSGRNNVAVFKPRGAS
ncbi:GGDEF domain-containing protein [Solidesulfovibrio sp.]|uniref:GGDEF domain-containing protein n=1 Tax=Solidesulfovibrio sp. TaxID=2910990 RepID=UPI002B21CAEF|nr:GGDEF domain-containing protein [Solidesulfovibrio sp.]MEA4856731.1 GGDEF domain-containing protein [Solidesulfovibrio sp.]